jgi:hypothetical protein
MGAVLGGAHGSAQVTWVLPGWVAQRPGFAPAASLIDLLIDRVRGVLCRAWDLRHRGRRLARRPVAPRLVRARARARVRGRVRILGLGFGLGLGLGLAS